MCGFTHKLLPNERYMTDYRLVALSKFVAASKAVQLSSEVDVAYQVPISLVELSKACPHGL